MSARRLIADRFAIEDPERDLLGRGGMGEVYRAIDARTGETIAVKALNPEIIEHDSTLLERFVREGEALRQLNHPNIVGFIASVEEAGCRYLVMEYVPGGSLETLLSEAGRLAPSRTVEIALEVADALSRAHHLGILHRDLKPSNVLMAKDGSPRLADFGIAYQQSGERLTQSGVLVGTVDYLSPEVCQGEPPDERSDIWSFGVLLFQILTGQLPFKGENLTAKLTAILTQPAPDITQSVPDIPDALADLVYRMLEKDAQHRIPSVRLVGAELEAIQKGREQAVPKPAPPWGFPAFLEKGDDAKHPVFVTRELELAQLDRLLNRALRGDGWVAFITGEPGQGKTALATEFARRACEKYPDLVIASGNCSAYAGIGDPYLPFREILELLCGDIETRWEARAISREQARRLWQCIPLAVQALLESGRDLVDIFVSGDTLIRRVTDMCAWRERVNWLPKLEQLVQHKAASPVDPTFRQGALFEQYTRLLRMIAYQRPLLLILDDLQWADSGSINLLFHLGKRIEGSRVMFLGAYRPSDVELGRGRERHPLEPIVNELRRQFGETQIDLGRADGRRFVDAILDSEPNRLGEGFRATLTRLTGGHPLGTVELLRDMEERGGLERDEEGCWVEGRVLNWGTLPMRVEAMIAERIERLHPIERQALKVASVEGETFTAEVVAQVMGEEPRVVLDLLSNELDKRHRLVSAQNIRQVSGKRLSIYRFQHILFQRYLHSSLDAVERPNLHQAVGTALKELHDAGWEGISGQLARHFQEAGTTEEAAEYLVEAGDWARELCAYQEAADHYLKAQKAYERGIGDQWDPIQQAALERKIGEAMFRKGANQLALDHLERGLRHLGRPLPASRREVRLTIVADAVRQLGHRVFPRLYLNPMASFDSRAVEEEARLCEILAWIEGFVNEERFLMVTLRMLNVAERRGFAYGTAAASMGLAAAGDMVPIFWLAGHYHDKAVTLAEQMQQPNALGLAYTGLTFHKCCLGEWDEAIGHGRRAANIYQEISDQHSWGYVAFMTGLAMVQLGHLAAALALSLDIIRAGEEGADLEVQCWGLWIRGSVQRRQGQFEEATSTLRKAMELAQASEDYLIYQAAQQELGQCHLFQGQLDHALATQERLCRYHFEHLTKSTVMLPLHNGLAEAYLAAAEQNKFEKSTWLQKAGAACRAALRHGRAYRAVLPDAMRLQGTYEWLRGKPARAQKWWRRGQELAETTKQQYDTGVINLEMGRRLRDRNCLERAAVILAGIGAEWDLARAQEALGEL